VTDPSPVPLGSVVLAPSPGPHDAVVADVRREAMSTYFRFLKKIDGRGKWHLPTIWNRIARMKVYKQPESPFQALPDSRSQQDFGTDGGGVGLGPYGWQQDCQRLMVDEMLLQCGASDADAPPQPRPRFRLMNDDLITGKESLHLSRPVMLPLLSAHSVFIAQLVHHISDRPAPPPPSVCAQ
jgi:hypothetical protein